MVLLWYDWNWADAEREIHRALQLNPDSVDALVALETHSVLVAGRSDEAAATSQGILNLDPLNPFSPGFTTATLPEEHLLGGPGRHHCHHAEGRQPQ